MIIIETDLFYIFHTDVVARHMAICFMAIELYPMGSSPASYTS